MTKLFEILKLSLVIMAMIGLTLIVITTNVRAQDAIANDPLGKACSSAQGAAGSPGCEKANENPIAGSNGIITKVIRLVQIAAVIMSTIMIILGGYTYVMSSGDPQKIKSAKDTILFALIGLTVAAAAQGIISFVLNKIG